MDSISQMYNYKNNNYSRNLLSTLKTHDGADKANFKLPDASNRLEFNKINGAFQGGIYKYFIE